MNATVKTVISVVVAAGLLGAIFYFATQKPDHLSSFNLSNERIARDLDGRNLTLGAGQFWPFEASQKITAKIVGRKQVDEFVVIIVEVSATAKVPEDEKEKKLPKKIALTGTIKLTYEQVEGLWYMVGLDPVAIRAVPREE